MLVMCMGLILFIAPHSLSFLASDWRDQKKEKLGRGAYEGIYSLTSLIALVLIVWGYGQTRVNPVFLWNPPVAMLHITALLSLVAFILLLAAYVPNNKIKTVVGHPMVAGVKVWAFAHLLSNGRLGDVVLFGAFLIWSVMYFSSHRRKDRATRATTETLVSTDTTAMTVLTVMAGIAAWAAMAFYLHLRLIGVAPFG